VRTTKETGVRKRNEEEKKNKPCSNNDNESTEELAWRDGGEQRTLLRREKKGWEVIY
jgi:hypothetical protein